jgi:hypothetical protein
MNVKLRDIPEFRILRRYLVVTVIFVVAPVVAMRTDHIITALILFTLLPLILLGIIINLIKFHRAYIRHSQATGITAQEAQAQFDNALKDALGGEIKGETRRKYFEGVAATTNLEGSFSQDVKNIPEFGAAKTALVLLGISLVFAIAGPRIDILRAVSSVSGLLFLLSIIWCVIAMRRFYLAYVAFWARRGMTREQSSLRLMTLLKLGAPQKNKQ